MPDTTSPADLSAAIAASLTADESAALRAAEYEGPAGWIVDCDRRVHDGLLLRGLVFRGVVTPLGGAVRGRIIAPTSERARL